MIKDMPPPVTKSSSKKDLWEELECAGEEIARQQQTINELRGRVAKAENLAGSLSYQLNLIRAVLAGEPNDGT